MRHLFVVTALLGAPVLAQTLAPGTVASTFQLNTFVSGLSQLTDFRFLPDGRVVMTEKAGTVKIRRTDGTVVVAGTFANVDSDSEKGLLGVELHPQFATNNRLFFYVSDGPTSADKHRVISIVLNPDNTLQCGGVACGPGTGSATVLLSNLMGPANHDGSGMAIGPDGKLYIGVGDTGCNSNAPPGTIGNYIGTCLTVANGKMLRINTDGSIPADNPLAAPGVTVPECSGACNDAPDPTHLVTGGRPEIWAWGFRNPFRFSFDPQTGRLWVADVGEVTYEEVNLVTKGQHYGWPWREGTFGFPVTTCDNLGPNGVGADCVEPKYFCKHAGGPTTAPDGGIIDGNCQSITGGVFLDTLGWPAAFQGRYWYGDNANGNVWTLTPNAARDGFIASPRTVIGTGFGTVIRFQVGPDGTLYIARLEGSILRLSPQAGLPDAGVPDAGAPDAGRPDSGVPDAGPRPDAGPPLDAGAIDFDGGTQPGGLASGAPFQGPEACRSCHSLADAGTLYMPYDTWVSTMMGNAIRDPLFQAALSIANQDVAGIGQWCLRCHSPPSFVQGHAASGRIGPLDAIDRAGVSCEACHRTQTSALLVGNARLTFEQTLTMHGPYDDATSPAHGTVGDAVIAQSALCGQCHQISNPVIHRAGTTRPFPLDTTYSEWLQSAYATGPQARTCQGCHMEVQPGNLRVATSTAVTRTDPPKHTFVGGNAWGLAAVQAADPTLAEFAPEFAATRDAALRNLQAAARVEVVMPPPPLPAGSEVELKVRVTNLTGHKLPTGYGDGRRVFIELSVGDQVVSGAYETGSATLIEDPQLAVFEALHGRADGGLDHLALHDTIFKDTRIEPLGFQPDADTEPVGISFLKGADGGALGAVEWTYRVVFPAELAGDAGVVTARLFHQATTRAYVEALSGANGTDSTGDTLVSIWNATGQAAPVEMASASRSVSLVSAADAGVSGSCGCHAASGSAAVFPALGVLVALVLRRRRIG